MSSSFVSSSLESLRRVDVEAVLADPASRQRYVTALFDEIVPSYDRFTRLFSLGMDAKWKRQLVERACTALPPGGALADLAAGTGDITRAVARHRGDARATGLDVSRAMIAAAARHPGLPPGARFGMGDLLRLPVRAASVDVVTVGYGFRNVSDAAKAVRETRRVLRPGGVLLSLDFYVPEPRWWRAVYLGYLRRAGGVAGWLLHRVPATYRYIAVSLERWMTWRQFSVLLESEGFVDVRAWPRLGGGICVHEARSSVSSAGPSHAV